MVTQQFSPVWSVLASDALVQRVLSRYPLDETPTCEFISAGLNDTYRVRAGSSTYYLRVYVHAWRELHDIEAEVELLNHLHAHELPVSTPIATRDGEYILPIEAPDGLRYAVLFSEAPGKHREENDRRSYVYGRLIGQLHACADRIPALSERFHLDHAYLMDDPLPRIKPFVEHRPKDFDYLSNIAPQLRARVDELLPKTQPEYGICHGDTHPWNIHYQDDDTPTLFDFDCFGHGWRAYDLAVVGLTLAMFDWSQKGKANRTRRWNLAIKGYEESRTLTDAEREALKVFPPICFIWAMGVHAALAPRHGGSWLNDEYLDEFIGFIRNWIKHYKVL